jgi:hypothetical protein
MYGSGWCLAICWKTQGRGGSGFWAGVACFMVIAGFLGLARAAVETMFPQLQEVWRIAAGDSDIGQHQFHILRAGTELEHAGGITFGVTNEMQELLDADVVIRVVHLNSRGGRVAEARKLRDLIRERRLITYTASVCASACTIAFMGGVQRYIAPEARLGFHQESFPGLTDEQLADEETTDRDWLIAAGVPAWFVERAFSTPSSSMWWPKPEELAHAGIITGIARPDDFAVSGMPAAATQEGVDKELQRKPCMWRSNALTWRPTIRSWELWLMPLGLAGRRRNSQP